MVPRIELNLAHMQGNALHMIFNLASYPWRVLFPLQFLITNYHIRAILSQMNVNVNDHPIIFFLIHSIMKIISQLNFFSAGFYTSYYFTTGFYTSYYFTLLYMLNDFEKVQHFLALFEYANRSFCHLGFLKFFN